MLLPALIGCGSSRNTGSGAEPDRVSNNTHYSIVVTDDQQMPLSADAMPDTFKLSDPDARLFRADANGHIKGPKDAEFGSLRILCRGYLPQDLRVDQLTAQKQAEIVLKRDPNKPDAGDGK